MKKVVAKSKKVTDFFHICQPKSNVVETTSSNAIALCSSLSDWFAEPEPNTIIASWEPNLQTESFNVAEDEAHKVTETIQNDMDVGCSGVISDHLRD